MTEVSNQQIRGCKSSVLAVIIQQYYGIWILRPVTIMILILGLHALKYPQYKT